TLVALSFCELGQAALTSDYLVQNFHAGKVSIEMTPLEASQQYASSHVKWWEPYPRVHVIDIDPSGSPGVPPAMRLHLDRDQKEIWLIALSDQRYQTAKGIRIGSTFGALRQAHPQIKIHIEEGEMDKNIVADIPEEGIAFPLEYDDATWAKALLQPD